MIRFRHVHYDAIVATTPSTNKLRVRGADQVSTSSIWFSDKIYDYSTDYVIITPKGQPLDLGTLADVDERAKRISALAEALKSGAITSSYGMLLGAAGGAPAGLVGVAVGAAVCGTIVGIGTGLLQYQNIKIAKQHAVYISHIAMLATRYVGHPQNVDEATLKELRMMERRCMKAGGASTILWQELERALRSDGIVLQHLPAASEVLHQ